MIGYYIDMQLSFYEGEDVTFEEVIEELDKMGDKALNERIDSVGELSNQIDMFSDLDY